MVQRPKIVRELDWIDNVWPRDIRVHEYPRVQLYCLMGVQDSYTDFHIDFGGTSVFYHVISGEKIFYFIEPTKQNLEIYGKWSMSPNQAENFLGDLTPCKKVHLKAGNTMFIPSGWVCIICETFNDLYSDSCSLYACRYSCDRWKLFALLCN